MSLHVCLDRKYEYAVVICAEEIGIVAVANGTVNGFLFSDADATSEPNTFGAYFGSKVCSPNSNDCEYHA